MSRLCGACCGLLVFSAMIVGGLLAGNPVDDILLRAWVGLFGGLLLGCLLGWIGMCIVSDNLEEPSDETAASDGDTAEVPRREPAGP